MKPIYSILFIVSVILVLTSSCRRRAVVSCLTTNTDFQHIFANTLAGNSSYQDRVLWDTEVHGYTFTVNAVKQLCKIGYMGNSALASANKPYTFEIFNTTTNAVVFSSSHVFNSATVDYINASGTLSPGNIYVIRRIVPAGSYSSMGDLVGRLCYFNSQPSPYPVSYGALTITGSVYHQRGGLPGGDVGIPYIDIVFQ